MKPALLSVGLLWIVSALSFRVNIPREIYEKSGLSADQINTLLHTTITARDDCPLPNTTTEGVIEGPPPVSDYENLKRNSFVKRNGTQLTLLDEPFYLVGPNVYWHGLDENVIPNPSYPSKTRVLESFGIVTAQKGTAIRGHTLGISVGTPLSLEPELDVWNEEAFEAIDFAILAARLYGIKLLIPLTDNYNWYHGGKYQFISWHGINFTGVGADILPPGVGTYFYNTTEIVDSFKIYISTLLNHVNQYTGIAYKDDPTIAAWESGNELAFARFGDGPAPPEWTRDIAKFVKGLSPNILFADGTYGIYQGTGQLDVEEVDIFSDHYYPPNITKLTTGIEAVHAANKSYLVGEFDWTGQKGDALDAFLRSAQDKGAIGSFYWALFGKDDECCQYIEHSDGFTFHYLRNNLTVEMGRILVEHAASLQGLEAPEVPPGVLCPQKVQNISSSGILLDSGGF